MSLLGAIFHPVGELQRTAEREVGPPALRQIEEQLGRHPLMPLIGLAITGAGLLLVVALTISAGAHADNFRGGPEATLDAIQFRPWFRITLLTGVGILLTGILTLLLAITVRIWWVTYTNRTLIPTILDAYRLREGKRPIFVQTDTEGSSEGSQKGGD
jgi:hypothetical protein